MRRYAQLKKLSPLEWLLLVASTLLLPLTALGLYFVGLKRTQHFIDYLSPSTSKVSFTAQQDLKRGQLVARMVTAAANHGTYGANCLERSLVTCWLLQYYGIAADLRIGVRKDDADLDAHSWVEINGNLLTGDKNTRQMFRTML